MSPEAESLSMGFEMENVFFYTFSTIAATFGSAVGIIFAAAIFRLQRIDQVAAGLAGELVKYHSDGKLAPPENRETQISRLNRIVIVQDWEKFLCVWKEYHPSSQPSQNLQEAHLGYLLGKVNAKKERIIDSLGRLVVETLLLIGVCFLGLANTQFVLTFENYIGIPLGFLGSFKIYFNIPLVLIVIFAYSILWKYAMLIYLIISRIVDYREL